MQERSPEERFWELVDRNGPVPAHCPELGSCWLWTRARFSTGYGMVAWASKAQGTHRVAWRLSRGPIPRGLCVLHRCDNPPCVRPEHLFIGTKGDNARDMIAKGRHHHLRKTHCPRGHPLSGDNLHINPTNGGRQCHTCVKAGKRRRYVDRARAAGIKPRPTTHCSRGHPYPESPPEKRKQCLICLRASKRRYYERNKEECDRRSLEGYHRRRANRS